MNDYDQTREQWLRDCENFFRSVQSYNTTVITVGYGTFFALLLFLQGKVNPRVLYIAALCMVVSAGLFVAFELIQNVKFALQTRKAGKQANKFFRFWASFYIPALLFAVAGTAILVYLFLHGITQQPPANHPPSVNAVPK